MPANIHTKEAKYKIKKEKDKLRLREWRKANPEENKARAKKLRDNETDEQRTRRLARLKEWKEGNKDHIINYQKEWRNKNKKAVAEYQKEYSKKYRKDNKFRLWKKNLYKNYNLTIDEFNELWQLQEGKCAICGLLMNPKGRKKNSLCVDHNHKTGEVRGLLCRGCNHAIGNLYDDPEVIMNAAEYLIERGFFSNNKGG